MAATILDIFIRVKEHIDEIERQRILRSIPPTELENFEKNYAKKKKQMKNSYYLFNYNNIVIFKNEYFYLN